MKKRLLALLLCLVMVIGLVPVALAGEPGEGAQETVTAPADGRYAVFYVNGKEVERTKDVVKYDAVVPAPSYNTSRPGYTFDGWYENSGKTGNKWDFTSGKMPKGSGNNPEKGFYATLTENSYTITFNANGGTGTMDNQTFTGGQTVDGGYVLLKKNTLTKEGHTFAGWTATVGSNTKLYSDLCAVSVADFTGNNGTYTLALTAEWKPVTPAADPITITYMLERGSEYSFTEEAQKNVDYTIAMIPMTWPVPAGMKFANKWTDAAGREYAVGTPVKFDKNTTLYPVFESDSAAKVYTVTFYCYDCGWTHAEEFNVKDNIATEVKIDPNGGKVSYKIGTAATTEITEKTAIFVTADTVLKGVKKTGYSFAGWKYDSSSLTFTAQWTKDYPYYNTYSIYYYDYDDCKSEYANFPYGTSVVIDPNGGTAKLSGTSFSTKQSFNIYRDYTLTDAARSGYTFYGWDLTKSGSTYYFTAMWSRYKSDVPYMLNGTDHYAYIKGYPNGSFKPTDTITRAEAATIFYRLLTDSTRKAYATTYNSFKDVPATAWYNTAVSTMAKLGIVNGGADGYFRPNDPITRAEIAAMIARCDGAYYTGSSTVFSDTYGHWAAGYIDRAYELGWINGYGTTYAPDRYISRAETVAVLNRVLNRAPQYTSDLTRNYTTFSDVATSAWYYLDVEEAANSHTYTRKSNGEYETWNKLIADPSWF